MFLPHKTIRGKTTIPRLHACVDVVPYVKKNDKKTITKHYERFKLVN